MNDKVKEIKKCEECGGKIVKDEYRSESYCEDCGLVLVYNHPMGHGINGLADYMRHQGLQDSIESIRMVATFQGLRDARLTASKL